MSAVRVPSVVRRVRPVDVDEEGVSSVHRPNDVDEVVCAAHPDECKWPCEIGCALRFLLFSHVTRVQESAFSDVPVHVPAAYS